MYTIHFDQPKHLYFIGIGGISMSGLACVLLEKGFRITGSDIRPSELTDRLLSRGARIYFGQKTENITAEYDAVVYTAAIHPDNPEFAAAVALGLPMLTRAQLLGQIMKNYSTAVAVAGTHGKTTTTSMLALMAMAADLDPTISVGGMLKEIGGNIRVGHSQTFITEACEYTNSFLSFYPTIAIILNIEKDHMDFFRDLSHIRSSFAAFAALPGPEGTVVINGAIPRLEELTASLASPVVTFGPEGSDYTAGSVSYDQEGHGSFDLLRRGKLLGHFCLRIPGSHNIDNALGALAAADIMGIPVSAMQQGLNSFVGAGRRFEKKGQLNGAEVIDDYAHHPTEIRVTLETASRLPHNKVWCVFQPHTYTRTKSLFKEFIDALSGADEVLLAEIYPARETDTLGMSSSLLAEHLTARGIKAAAYPSFADIEDYLRAHVQKGDLVLTVGAGSVTQISRDLTGGASL